MRSGRSLPPVRRDPAGIHAELFQRHIEDDGLTLPEDKPLTFASYVASSVIDAYVESAAVGDALLDMPLFLTLDGLHVV